MKHSEDDAGNSPDILISILVLRTEQTKGDLSGTTTPSRSFLDEERNGQVEYL